MKTFCVTHHLVGGSGFQIYIIRAENETEAERKYIKKSFLSDRTEPGTVIGLSVEEITTDVYLAIRYDDPTYEG